MKKIVCFFITAFLLTACSGNPKNGQAASNENKVPDGFVFEYKDKKIYMGEDINDAISDIGEPKKTFEAPSCAFDGIDKIFSYSGFDLHTYPEGEKDLIHTINLRDDSIKTAEGIMLGSGFSDMLKTYGDGYEQELGMYTYGKGKTKLQFLIVDEYVDAIMYLYEL